MPSGSKASETVQGVTPGDADLVTRCAFGGNANAPSGNGNNGVLEAGRSMFGARSATHWIVPCRWTMSSPEYLPQSSASTGTSRERCRTV